MLSPSGRTKALAPVRPSAAIEREYRRRLDTILEEMHKSLLYWISAAYRQNEPEIAQLATDASPARSLAATVRRLSRRWLRRFDDLSIDLAGWFAKAAADRSDLALRHSLRKGGFSVRFKMTRPVNDVLQGSIAENVSLIKSIAQQHLTQVEGIVARSVQNGRDLGYLSKELQAQFGVTKRRAALISRDQNAKATAVISRVRQQEVGITHARWQHSHGGKEPRPSHVKASRDRVIFTLAEGWLDPAINKRIWPGTEINCRCVSQPVLEGYR